MADLCTACMCNGRKLYYIGETEFYHLFTQILNEIHVYDSSPFYIKVCWECVAHLRSWLRFKEQAKRCYTQLQYVQQNNFVQEPQPSHLAIAHVHNFSYPEPSVDMKIKIETDEMELRETETHPGDERDRLQDIKTEETHCEPETFVNNLNLEPKKKRGRKVDKPIKQKPKKKVKPKTVKIPVEKKIKVKKKERSPSPDSVQNDHDDAQDFEEDGEDKDIEPEKKEEDDMPLLKEITRLNGSSKVGGREGPEKEPVLPERPHCDECGKNFSSRKTYRYHLNVLHKGQNRYPCPRCGKVYQWKSNLGRHLRSHKARDSGELYCETCDKRFASVATYRQHLRVSRRHVPESDFSFMCNECGKKFVNKTRLRDHIDWEHLKKIKFRCQLCNKPFKCHTSLYVHLQNVHHNKEKKDNLCHVCGKSYQNAAKLKYHIVAMHTSETPYQCQHCSAAFGWYSSLYRHVREVHYKLKLQPRKTKKVRKEDIHPSLLPPPPHPLPPAPPHPLPPAPPHPLPHSSGAPPQLPAPP